MTTALLVIVLIIVTFSMYYLTKHENSTPTPRKESYLAMHPERVVNGLISCGCGSTDIHATGTPSNYDTFIICRCKSCNTLLYTASAGDKNPLEVEAV